MLNKVWHLIKREMPELRKCTKDIALVRAMNPAGVESVGAALTAHGIASGGNYISAWKYWCRTRRRISATTLRHCKLARRAISKIKPWSRQATDMPLEKLLERPHWSMRQPLVSSGPLWPFLVAMMMLLWMWRGLEARSARRTQFTLDENKQSVTYTVVRRKNCQDGARGPRVMTLRCTCQAHPGCAYCVGVFNRDV